MAGSLPRAVNVTEDDEVLELEARADLEQPLLAALEVAGELRRAVRTGPTSVLAT